MTEVSTLRLRLLRGTYLLMAVGLALSIWPVLLAHEGPWRLWHGVGVSQLAALSPLALLGLRRPLAMLPLLFFELAWKSIWTAAVAFPMWRAGTLDAATTASLRESALGLILLPLVIPWRHARDRYLRRGAAQPR
jgi:hypothetical protein